jgi:hypothetical protein
MPDGSVPASVSHRADEGGQAALQRVRTVARTWVPGRVSLLRSVAQEKARLSRFAANVGGLAIFLLLSGRLWWLVAHAPLDVNEGWNAMQSMRAFEGRALYPGLDALTANNYPPLSFYIVGSLGQILGDNIVAGRIVSLVSQALTGAAIYAAVGRLTSKSLWPRIGMLLFWGFGATMLRHYTAMNDPQWLADAAMSWGLVLVLPSPSRKVAPDVAVVAAACLTVIGLMTKHNVIAIPIVITVWLCLTNRRALLIWCLSGTFAAFAACGVLLTLWGAAPFADIFGATRTYSLSRMLLKGGQDLLAILPAIIACLGLWRVRAQPSGMIPLLLLAISVPLGVIQRSGDAVNVNAFFEAVIALAIAVPTSCAADPARAKRTLALAALPVLSLAPFAAVDAARLMHNRSAAVQLWSGIATRLAEAPGPVACDDQSACYWAGRDASIDVFSLKQRLLKGGADVVRTAIREQRFALIELRTGETSWHADLLRPLIRSNYVVSYTAKGVVLLVPANPKRNARL